MVPKASGSVGETTSRREEPATADVGGSLLFLEGTVLSTKKNSRLGATKFEKVNVQFS